MKPDFMVRIAKIMAEIRAITFIDEFDKKAIEDILQKELKECYDDVYYEGYYEGYDGGYDEGYDEGRSEV